MFAIPIDLIIKNLYEHLLLLSLWPFHISQEKPGYYMNGDDIKII